jgi:protein ImuA
MATSAVARETVFALRRQIARIEGTPIERFDASVGLPCDAGHVVIRRNGLAENETLLCTGVAGLDAALGGGLPKAALTEIHGAETRDAGAVAGFALALVSRLIKDTPAGPVLWIGTAEVWRESGPPNAKGLQALFGIAPQSLLFCEAPKLADALWIAEEAVRLTALSAVVLEIRGNPQRLDLTASRRLHARAQSAGRPALLLRQAAQAEPTAAPVRLVVSPAPSAPRNTIAGPLDGSIGRPAFTVSVSKSRTARSGQFTLEWNPDERAFDERHSDEGWGDERWGMEKRATDPVAVVSLPRRRADIAATPGAVLAFPAAGSPAAPRPQPSRTERPTHRRTRRAG